MLHYTCKRILGALPVFFGITLFVFFLINMAPATIADAAGGGEASSAAVRAALEANLGLDKPLPLRYVLWLKALLQGDLGLSYRTGQPVVTMIAQRVVPSLILTGTGVAAAILLGIPLGVMAAWKPKSGWGKLAGGLTLLSFSAPGFFLCVLAIFLFSVVLGWLPAAGMYSAGGGGSVGDLLLHLISRAKVNIRDIFVSEITEQYLQSIEDLSGLDMDAASEFLQMAATLLEIKSRALLPKPPKTEDEEDPQEVLMRRLEEYKRIKEAGKTLRIYEAEAQEMVTRLPLEMVTEARIELSQMSLESLQAAFLNVLLRAERSDAAVSPMRQIERDTFTIGECMLRIQRRVIVQRRVRFDELFPADATRSEIITIFLAMLELLKANRITLQQEDIYAPIMIERGKETAADDADGTDFGG